MNNHQDGHADDFPTAILFFFESPDVLLCPHLYIPKTKKKKFFFKKKKITWTSWLHVRN